MTPEEFKKLMDELKRDVESFKSENNTRLKELEAKKADPILIEKVDRVSAGIDKIEDTINKKVEDRLKALETAHNRSAASNQPVDEKAKKAAVTSAMNSYFRKGFMTPEQRQAVIDAMPEEWKSLPEYKALSVDNDPAGGYLVQPEMSSVILNRIFETSPMRQLCSVETIGSDQWEEKADWGQDTVGWVGERESRTATATGELNVLKIPVNELYAMPSLTQKMIDDGSINIEAWHAQKVARDLGLAENTAFITGNGINRPRGIATYSNGSTYGTVAQVSLGGSAAITVDGLMDLQGALYEQYQPQAWFAMRRATRTYIRKLVDGEGRYLWSLDGGAVQGVQEMLLGQPVKLMADVAAIAASSLSVIYGDFKGYLIVDRIGIRVLRDPYSTKGSVLLYTTKRVGGGMRDFDAIKIGICA